MKIEIANLNIEDFTNLKETMITVYKGFDEPYWSHRSITKLTQMFPEGQIAIKVEDKIVAAALSIIVDYDKYGDSHTYEQITANYTFKSHDAAGDVLYGIDLFVHPDYRGLRLGRRLYDARKELCESLNLKSIMAGGRIPTYSQYHEVMSPKEYIFKVKNKEIYDGTLTFQFSNDFHVKKVLSNYLKGDKESKEFATLLEWNNIYYQGDLNPMKNTKTVVRLGLVQWQMRMFRDVDALIEQIDYFVDAVSDYQSDFVLFPELFNAPLLGQYNDLGTVNAIRALADHTDHLLQVFQEKAVSYNINIISGSMPQVVDGNLKNVSFLCRRDGTYEKYEKIHITPSEKNSWNMAGGDTLKVFDTDCGKIGILICYDVEFPELSRIYADQGIQILFVPFLTDTQNGFNRVKICAQARAVENECYVAIAGCVGNLPKVHNMDLQYAQSAIYTPSDFAFPTNAIKAEATPNTEMVVIGDVDLSLLKELHEYGSVKNLKDRRKDLYRLGLSSSAPEQEYEFE